MKLVSMKIDKADREKKYSDTVAADAPMYPYGLTVNVDNDSVDKVFGSKLPEVGDERWLMAKVKVSSVSSSDSEYGKNQNVSLQITDMAITDVPESKDAGKALYGE